MDPIEKAIRNAFEKGDAGDRAFREKVYRSAFAALDRALQANPGATVEAAIKRRKAMQARIAEIESEFLPAVGSPPAAAGPVEPPAAAASAPPVEAPPPGEAPVVRPAPAERREPAFAPQPAAPPAAGPRTHVLPSVPDIMPEPPLPGSAIPAPAEVVPDRDERRARRRFPAGALLGVLVLAAAGFGAWWAMQFAPFAPRVGTPPAAADGGEAPPASAAPQMPGAADDARDWITVFTPADPTHVGAPSDAGAEVMQDDGGSFLRIRSGPSGSAVSFDVGQGVLERLAGKHAVFDIVARSEEGKETQMSVDCNFGELGDCGRKRYGVGPTRDEYLFDVALPDKEPGAAGSIAISSDFEGKGRSVDIYGIKVSVDQ